MTHGAKIEVVRMHKSDNGSRIKAFCDLQFENDFIVKGFKVVQSDQGFFIGMPSEPSRNGSGKWFNTFMPLSDEVKTRIEETILSAYEE